MDWKWELVREEEGVLEISSFLTETRKQTNNQKAETETQSI